MTQESNTKPQTPKLKPDFSHHIYAMSDDAYPGVLSDAVSHAADSAISILYLISDQFVDEKIENVGGRWSNKIMFAAIEAAINQVKDTKSLVEAYYEAHDPKPKANEPA